MAKLVVNVDHVATVRQARLAAEPDPVTAAALAELGGCEGIIVHLREDRRHIQDRDLELLRKTVRTRLNLEMAAVPEMLAVAQRIVPDMACLVPEKRAELTTEGGLDVAGQKEHLAGATAQLHDAGITVSLFIDADRRQIEAAREVGAEYVELHTGRYCDAPTPREGEAELARIIEGIDCAAAEGLRVNVGHGLNYQNVRRLAPVRHIEEFSIGHSIIARAVLVGMERAVREMVALIKGAC